MVPPANTDDTRIRRSKSATSVKERRKHPLVSAPLDPNSARVHAVITAHRAMDRSRTSTSDDLARSDSSASKQSIQTHRPQKTSSHLPAAQSQKQRSILQETTPSLAVTLSMSSTNDIIRDGSPAGIQTSLISEAGRPSQGEPSSFRRLRKSKSLLHPRQG